MDLHLFIDAIVCALVQRHSSITQSNRGAGGKTLAPHLLKDAYADLSQRYRTADANANGFQNIPEMIAYVEARFPATYAVVDHILRTELVPHLELASRLDEDQNSAYAIDSILDLGAGPGTASLAALRYFGASHMTMVEQTLPLLQSAAAVFRQIFPNTTCVDVSGSLCETLFPAADLVLLSYVLTEMPESKALSVYEVSLKATTKFNLMILPGTPAAFRLLLKLRALAINKGYTVMAPCPHAKVCPLSVKMAVSSDGVDEWCHFRKRLERVGSHQDIKQGSLGYEDEPYCYLLVANPAVVNSVVAHGRQGDARIIQTPRKRSGHVIVDVCASSGVIEERCVTKKNKEAYARAKRLKWGDLFFINNRL